MRQVNGEPQVSTNVEQFFRKFERYANDGDAVEASSQFAEVFMAADPTGFRSVPAAALMGKVSQRKKMLEVAGNYWTKLISLEEKELGDWYVLVETEWRMEFDKNDKEIVLRSTFIVHRADDGLRIVFYLAHQNLMEVLKEGGVMVP